MTKVLIDEDEAEQIARQKHRQRVRYLRYAWAAMSEAEESVNDPLRYLLEGTYHNGEMYVPVHIEGSDLEECVQKLKDADPNFGVDKISFIGGWVCPDYDVTAQVRSLV